MLPLPLRCWRGTGAIGVALALLVQLPAAAGASESPVRLDPMAEVVEFEPGAFATWAYRVENTSAAPVTATLEVVPPSGWTPVTAERRFELKPSEQAMVPFSVWVPSGASADRPYPIEARLTSPGGDVLALLSQDIRVSSKHGLGVKLVSSPSSGRPGARLLYTFRVDNLGNGTADYVLTASEVPDWDTELSGRRITLLPRESRDITATVRVPGTAKNETQHVLTLEARLDRPGLPADGVVATARVASTVRVPVTNRSRYRTLPAALSFSAEGEGDGHALYHARLGTEGAVSEDTRAMLELDLISEEESKDQGEWSVRQLLAAMGGANWNASLGDVRGVFPDVATGTLAGRGASCRWSTDTWGGRLFAAKETRDDDRIASAAGVERRVTPSLWLGADVIGRTLRATSARTERDLELWSLTGRYLPRPDWDVVLEGAQSRSGSEDGTNTGSALQAIINHDGPDLRIQARAYGGTERYEGRTRDRDGLVAYARYSSTRSLALWTSSAMSRGRAYEGYDAPQLLTGWGRIGAQVSPPDWPRMELSVGEEFDSEGHEGELRKVEQRDATLRAWDAMGPVTIAASGYLGRGYNRLKSTSGTSLGFGASLGWNVAGMGSALSLNRDEKWVPDAEATSGSSTVDGDLDWTSRGGRCTVGLRASLRWNDTQSAEQPVSTDHQVQPRASWRIARGLTLRLQTTFRGVDSDLELDRWQIQLTWAAADAVPIPWSPTAGGIRGVVFLDRNMNGRVDRGERRVPGVILLLNGEQQVSDENGAFDFPAVAPGTYLLDLNPASLPAGLATLLPLPAEIRIEAGGEATVPVALAESCELTGLVFHDANYDGIMSADEAGAADIRMVLVRGGTKVTETLTDKDGRYRFRDIMPGDYVVRADDRWLPSGWRPTTAGEVSISVVGRQKMELPPYGIAAIRKPIVKTFGEGRTRG